MNVICTECGKECDYSKIGLGYNVGFGPKYFCLECVPPVGIKETMVSIQWAMDFTMEEG